MTIVPSSFVSVVRAIPQSDATIKVGNTEDYVISIIVKDSIPVAGTIEFDLPSEMLFKSNSSCHAAGTICSINTTT